jgi:epoxyqueuosine reductase QueG
MNAELKETIKALAGHSTADLIGIAPGSAFSVEELGELGAGFGKVSSVIVLAQHIVDPIQTVRFQSSPHYRDSSVAASFGDALLRHTCWQVVEILRSAEYQAAIPRNQRYGASPPAHSLSYKKAGVLAGMGAFGKNQLLIHPEWGPWLWLRTVITDAILPPDSPLDFSPCRECYLCAEACPTGAVSENGFDRNACEIPFGKPSASHPSMIRLSPMGQINCEKCMRACPIGVAPPLWGEAETGL